MNLDPLSHDITFIAAKDAVAKQSYKRNFNRHHGPRPLDELQPGDVVLQKLDNEKLWRNPAVVQRQVAPRSYVVKTSRGTYRRNRRHLRRFQPDSQLGRFPGPTPTQSKWPGLSSIPKTFLLPTHTYPVTSSPVKAQTYPSLSQPGRCLKRP